MKRPGLRVWLVRHTAAVPGADDARRELSPAGRAAAQALGRQLRRTGALAGARMCWHSPLVRARQTAAGMLAALGGDVPARVVAGLAPEDDPGPMADRLERRVRGDLIVVGHEPHLGRLGTLLVRGRAGPGLFELKKGAVLALERTERKHRRSGRRRWRVRWLLAPELCPPPPAKTRGGTDGPAPAGPR